MFIYKIKRVSLYPEEKTISLTEVMDPLKFQKRHPLLNITVQNLSALAISRWGCHTWTDLNTWFFVNRVALKCLFFVFYS